MAGFDPATDPRVRQAVNADRAMRGLPPLPEPGMPAPGMAAPPPVSSPDAQDAIAMQDAALAQQAANDATMSGVGAPPAAYMAAPDMSQPPAPVAAQPQPAPTGNGQVDAPLVMSMRPEDRPVGENYEEQISEPVANYPGEQPPAGQAAGQAASGPSFTAADLARLLGRGNVAAGVRNPVPGMLRDATARRTEAEAQAKGYEQIGDEASAGIQEAGREVGAAREATFADVGKVYDKQAAETTAYQRQLADLEDSSTKAMSQVQQEERDINAWMEQNRTPRDRRGFAQKVTGALAVALSGLADQAILAASMNAGTPVQSDRMSTMVGLIQRGIDRDLESQRQMFDNARTEVAGKQTEYGQLREKKLDDRQALTVARALGLERAANEIDAIKSRGLSAEQVPLAEQAAEALRLERANLLQGVYNQRFEQAFNREHQLKMLRYQQSQPRTMSAKDQLDLEGKALANEKARRELEGGGADANGAYGMQALPGAKPSEKGTQEAQKLVSATEGIRATISQLRGMAAKGATLSPTERDIARRRLQSIKSQFNGVFGDGTAPNEAQLKAMDEIFSNPTEVNMSDVAKTLEVFDRDAVEMTNAKIRPYGFRLEDINVRPE